MSYTLSHNAIKELCIVTLVRCGYLKTFLLFGLYTMQEPLCVGKIALVSIWFRLVLAQIII